MNQTEYESKSMKELFVELARVYFIKNYQVLSEMGIHPGQEALLNLVYNDSGLSQKEIAGKLKIQPPTVAVSLKRMEKAGWLRREIDTSDKRISRVYITDEGKNVLYEVREKSKELDKIIFKGIPDVEKCLLRRIIIHLIENITNSMNQNEMDEMIQKFKEHHHESPIHHDDKEI